jgi:hypothetical protein
MYDEEDLAAIAQVKKMGYRYFSKPDSKNVADIAPKRLEAPALATGTVADTAPTAASVWNAAGTFEERNYGPWLRGRVKELLAIRRKEGLLSLQLRPDQWLCTRGICGWGSSSADVIIARSKVRYVYDVRFSVVLEVVSADEAAASCVDAASFIDEDGSAVSAADDAAPAPSPPPADVGSADPPKKAPRILLTIEAGADNEPALPGSESGTGAGRDLMLVPGAPKPSSSTLARAKEAVLGNRGEGIAAVLCATLEAALSEFRAK